MRNFKLLHCNRFLSLSLSPSIIGHGRSNLSHWLDLQPSLHHVVCINSLIHQVDFTSQFNSVYQKNIEYQSIEHLIRLDI